MSGEHDGESLRWRAFCYLADELSDEERERFESLLASDQGARESLAEAVELTSAVAESLEMPQDLPDRRSPVTGGRRRWWALAAGATAVALMWMVAGHNLPVAPESGPAAGAGSVDSDSHRHLATVWAESYQPFSLDEQESAWSQGEVSEDPLAGMDAMEIEAPSWMLAAVASMRSPEAEEEQ